MCLQTKSGSCISLENRNFVRNFFQPSSSQWVIRPGVCKIGGPVIFILIITKLSFQISASKLDPLDPRVLICVHCIASTSSKSVHVKKKYNISKIFLILVSENETGRRHIRHCGERHTLNSLT